MPPRKLLFIATLFGAFAVILGAFGAHTLKPLLTEQSLATWQTGVFYHLTHSVLLSAVCIRLLVDNHRRLRLAAFSFAFGIFLFSGSLYGLALGGPDVLGPVTPIGGLLLITGWLCLAGYAMRLPAPDR